MKKKKGVKQSSFCKSKLRAVSFFCERKKSAKNTRGMFVASLPSRELRVFRAWESILPVLLSLVKSSKLLAV